MTSRIFGTRPVSKPPRFFAAVATLVTLVGPGETVAQAQAADISDSAAEALFAEGRQLMRAGRYAEACQKFRQSQTIDPAIGTLMNLGLCSRQQGLTATAWNYYRRAAALAQTAGQLARVRVAQREADALEPTLSRLLVSVPVQLTNEKLALSLDGASFAQELWGMSTPIDPGQHELTVAAPGVESYRTRFQVLPGQRLVLEVPSLARSPRRTAPSTAEGPYWNTRRTVAAIEGGLGVGALALGAVLASTARERYDSAPGCTGNLCGEPGVRSREIAIEQANLATWMFTFGISAFVGAGVLWLSAPTPQK